MWAPTNLRLLAANVANAVNSSSALRVVVGGAVVAVTFFFPAEALARALAATRRFFATGESLVDPGSSVASSSSPVANVLPVATTLLLLDSTDGG